MNLHKCNIWSKENRLFASCQQFKQVKEKIDNEHAKFEPPHQKLLYMQQIEFLEEKKKRHGGGAAYIYSIIILTRADFIRCSL